MTNTTLDRIIRSSLVFIDSTVDNLDQLVAGIAADSEVILLNSCQNGVAQITAALARYANLSSLHIIAHGSPGSLRLGNSNLSLETLKADRSQLQQWRNALGEDAEILLYGCRVGSAPDFIHQLQSILGVHIAASSTPVGSAAQGGNWDLDVAIGTVKTAIVFSPQVQAAYASVLIDTYIDEDFSDASGSTPPPGWTNVVITGDPAVDQWRFDNPGDRTLPVFETEPSAIFDSDNISNNDQLEDVALVSPVFNAVNESTVYLRFDQEYLGLVDPDYGSEGFVEVFDGTQWQTVADQVDDAIGPTTIDISQYAAGVADAQVRFRWTGNWSYYWSLDNVQVVDTLVPGVRVVDNPSVSEDNVPDPLRFQFVLDKQPTSDVTISFAVDSSQLQPIAPLTFTPDNWNLLQAAPVAAVADGIPEGDNQKSPIKISVTSADSEFNGLTVADATATISENTIPEFPSYRTVEATVRDLSQLATQNPEFASWVDIGDSYDKITPGGAPGYDIYSLELTNKSTNKDANKYGPKGKPVVFIEAAIHAREYSTAEVLSRFAEDLVAGYGTDADTTALLDYFDIRIVPIVNPDGRKFAEQGYSWRKNTNPNPPPGQDPAPFPVYGVDLNRNYDAQWGKVPGGSSGNPSSLTYRGTSAFSEPESQALRDYLLATFPDQKGPGLADAAPEDATGVYLDLHSFGNLVLYPYGFDSNTATPEVETAPNATGLRNFGLKFGYFTGVDGASYDVQQAIGLYPTDGTTDEWVYETFGSAAYTIEMGTSFFQDVDYFENIIVPELTPAFYYTAKSGLAPYKTSAGPDTIDASLAQPQAVQGISETVTLLVTADDTRYDDDNLSSDGITEGLDLPTPVNIKSARYSIDAPSWIEGTKTYGLDAADGAFDEPIEQLTAAIDTTKLSIGRHTIFVESEDAAGNYGVFSSVFLDVLAAPKNAVATKGTTDDDKTVIGKRVNDIVYGRGGDDEIRTNSGTDIVLAGRGKDFVNSGADDDLVYGGGGDDYLDGSGGNDKLYGEAGADRLVGYDGDDLLWGGEGDDFLIGGKGADTYRLALNEGTDRISGFELGKDLIDLGGTIGFKQVSIAQSGKDTLIGFQKQTLAILQGVAADLVTAAAFVPV